MAGKIIHQLDITAPDSTIHVEQELYEVEKYKRKLRKLAEARFERDKDKLFFVYMDRLLAAEEIVKTEYIGLGPQMLHEFVEDKNSISAHIKNRIYKERIAKARAEKGLPEEEPPS